jgi:hypothetical protein
MQWHDLDGILGLNAVHGPRSLWTNAGHRHESGCVAGAGLETGGRTWRNKHCLTNAEVEGYGSLGGRIGANDYHDGDEEQDRVWDDAVPVRHCKGRMTLALLHT